MTRAWPPALPLQERLQGWVRACHPATLATAMATVKDRRRHLPGQPWAPPRLGLMAAR